MVSYLEFTDDWKNALDHLNDYVKKISQKRLQLLVTQFIDMMCTELEQQIFW